MSRSRALTATLTVIVAALAACSTSYEPSRDEQAAGSVAAVAPVDGRAHRPSGDRVQTGNLPS